MTKLTNSALKAALLVLLSLILNTAIADQSTKSIHQRISGSLVDSFVDPNPGGTTANLLSLGAQGTFGRSNINGLIEVDLVTPTGDCPEGQLQFDIIFFSVVQRFRSGDLLFSQLKDGVVCGNPDDSPLKGVINATIIGGTGRFAKATGSYQIEADVLPLLIQGTNVAQAALDGTLQGTINFSR